MAQIPQTPAQLTFDGNWVDDTPLNSAVTSSPETMKQVPKMNFKRLSEKKKKKKMQATFASLYDDENLIDLQYPGQVWTAGNIAHSVTDATMEHSNVEEPWNFEVAMRDTIPEMEIYTRIKNIEVEDTDGYAVRTEWLGTSQFYVKPLLELQRKGDLDQVIAYRQAVARDIACFPYDPVPLLTLSSTHGQLGFSDIAVGNAYRAILLIEAAMGINSSSLNSNSVRSSPSNHSFPEIDILARSMLSKKFHKCGLGPHSIEDELQHLHRQAYQMLLAGLLGTGANWEGLLLAKNALKQYPDDIELRELQYELKGAFLDRSQAYKEVQGVDVEKGPDMVECTRMGKIYQKKYPWIDQDLYKRTPAILRDANKAFEGSSCEVKEVTFGNARPIVTKECQDVGPLGIFATRDIEEGELVMLDRTIAGVCSIPSSNLEHCDACQGCLMPPYMRPESIIRPTCCSKVAYCSSDCYRIAATGYHRVLCGKDFGWLYENIKIAKTGGAPSHWKSINFLRVVAVVLADIGNSGIHPLRHSLLARMSANYPLESKIPDNFDVGYQWLYFTNVVAPTQILLQLGVNVFTDPHWTQETIQTIFWRIENNANMAITDLTGKKVHLVNISPNYLFFNHSCQPNISWHGACPDGNVGIDWLMTPEGGVLQPGCSAVWCIAARDIKKGEQLMISYVGNPRGDDTVENGREAKRAWLCKWFDNGCGCSLCEEENRSERDRARDSSFNNECPDSVETGTEMEGVVTG